MVKKFLRLNPPEDHWHVSESGEEMDTFFSLTGIAPLKPAEFFKLIAKLITNVESDYSKIWHQRCIKIKKARKKYLQKIPWSDLRVFDLLLDGLPKHTILHLGNSTPVRYSQLFGSNPDFIYQSNRGVSGIDGQVSTAAGYSSVSKRLNIIITGDLGFFYDSNALMNHHLTPNLKIIVINNGGGGIFRFIEGPDSSPYLEQFFEAKHDWKAEKIAEAFDITYLKADTEKNLEALLSEFYYSKMKRPALLEIFTPGKVNAKVLKEYFIFLKSATRD
jgi:2-succinyl-5-enolpyruvyl-6-hydroxy-3-cyclohexene-1-carboxylate synthase